MRSVSCFCTRTYGTQSFAPMVLVGSTPYCTGFRYILFTHHDRQHAQLQTKLAFNIAAYHSITMAVIRKPRLLKVVASFVVVALLCLYPSVVVGQRSILSMMKVTRDPAQQQSQQHFEGEDSFFLAIVATTLFLVLGGFAVVMASSSGKRNDDERSGELHRRTVGHTHTTSRGNAALRFD